MKNLLTALSFLLLGALALGLAACGTNSSGSAATNPNSSVVTGSWADVTVVSDSQQVTLSWTDKKEPDDNTSTYNIYWSDSAGVSKTAGNKIAIVTSPYVHTGLANGATYYYVVTRVVGGVEGEISYEVSAQPQASLPAAPADITITAGDGEVTLAWPGVKSTGTGTGLKYNIYWSTTAGVTKSTGTKIPNVTASQTAGDPFTFTHNNLLNDASTTYYYLITAVTTEGESDASRQVSAKPLKPQAAVNFDPGPPEVLSKLGTPTGINALPGNQKVTIGWNQATSPTYNGTADPLTYNIIWWTTDSTDTKTISNLSSTSFTHLSLTNGTTYHYKVTAVQKVTNTGTSSTFTADSAQVSVVPEAATPAVPAGLSAATGNQQVSLSWIKDKSGSSVTYNIYWSTDPKMNPDNVAKISDITTNTFVHSGLITGKPYYYRVTAQIEGESDFSNIISATP